MGVLEEACTTHAQKEVEAPHTTFCEANRRVLNVTINNPTGQGLKEVAKARFYGSKDTIGRYDRNSGFDRTSGRLVRMTILVKPVR